VVSEISRAFRGSFRLGGSGGLFGFFCFSLSICFFLSGELASHPSRSFFFALRSMSTRTGA
jgi:hypothetical protein